MAVTTSPLASDLIIHVQKDGGIGSICRKYSDVKLAATDAVYDVANGTNGLAVEAIDGEFKNTEEFIQKLNQYNAFFVKLLAYYIAERYPSYKEKLSQAVNQQEATDVLALTEEVFI